MDTFFRSAAHNIVTTVLLVIWSGLLLGVTWKVLSHFWNALCRLLPFRNIPLVKVLAPSHPRLSVSTMPALVANNPEPGLSEAPLPLLPPQDDLFVTTFFQLHNYRTFVRHKEDTTL